jgi:hypothetical protein
MKVSPVCFHIVSTVGNLYDKTYARLMFMRLHCYATCYSYQFDQTWMEAKLDGFMPIKMFFFGFLSRLVLVGFKVGKLCKNNMTRGELHSIITMYGNRLNIYVKRGTDSMHG